MFIGNFSESAQYSLKIRLGLKGGRGHMMGHFFLDVLGAIRSKFVFFALETCVATLLYLFLIYF